MIYKNLSQLHPVLPFCAHIWLQLYFRWLKNLWKSNLWWLFDLLLFNTEFHVLDRNDELSQFWSLGNRQQSRAVWLGYSLFEDQKLLHYKGDVTSRLYTERYQNAEQYFEDYPPNGIPTNFQKSKINTVCVTGTNSPRLPKSTVLSTSALQIQIYWWQVFRDNDWSRQCLIGHTAGRTCL